MTTPRLVSHERKLGQRQLESAGRVAEVMIRSGPRAGPGTRVDEIIDAMLQRDLDGVPIVDARGVLIGFASRIDMLRALWLRGETESEALLGAWLRAVLEDDPLARTDRASRTPLFEVMPTTVERLPESATLLEAADLLGRSMAQEVPVVTPDRRPLGVVSALEVVAWICSRARLRQLFATPAHELTGTGPLGVMPGTDLHAVAGVLVDWRLRQIPVIGPDRKLEGMIGTDDLLRASPSGRARARDVMQTDPPALEGDATLRQVMELMASERIHQVALTDDDGRVVGSVSALDVLRWCTGR